MAVSRTMRTSAGPEFNSEFEEKADADGTLILTLRAGRHQWAQQPFWDRPDRPAAAVGIAANRHFRSFLWHAGLAQAGEISGVEQGVGLRHSEIRDGLRGGD